MATGYTIANSVPPYKQVQSNYNTVQLNWSAPCGGMYVHSNVIPPILTNDEGTRHHVTWRHLCHFYSATNQNKAALQVAWTSLENFFLAVSACVCVCCVRHCAMTHIRAGKDEADGLSGYGLAGWEEAYDMGRWVLTKGGLVDGFAASIAIDPYLKLGVAAFVNFPNGYYFLFFFFSF